LIEAVLPSRHPPTDRCKFAAAPIHEFARAIGAAVREHILPRVSCRICFEPGRWVCHEAMHLALTVVDRKGDDIAVTDAGTNAVGWERFESDYFPVINLSRPDTVERPMYVLGALCTPHDVWGYAYHGGDIQPGDVLLIPNQGAYTYSLRQEFIKPLPRVVDLAGPQEA
jgi:diaminopimelate decarboxylase